MFVLGLIVGLVILAVGFLAGYRIGGERWPWKGVEITVD